MMLMLVKGSWLEFRAVHSPERDSESCEPELSSHVEFPSLSSVMRCLKVQSNNSSAER